MAIEFNFSNFTNQGIIRVAFLPYTSLFGNYFWGIMFGFIGAGIYAKKRSKLTTAIYLIIVGIFFGIVLPYHLAYLLGLVLAFLITVIFYNTYIEKKSG